MLSNPNMTTKCSLQTQKNIPKEIKLATDIYDVKFKQTKTLLQYNLTKLKSKNNAKLFSSCIQTLPILTMKKTNSILCTADRYTQKAYCICASCKSFWCVL